MKGHLINKLKNKVASYFILLLILNSILFISCSSTEKNMKVKSITAEEILNNPEYLAISYGGYRKIQEIFSLQLQS